MLLVPHHRAYQAFLTLLIEFNYLLKNERLEINQTQIRFEFERLKNCYQKQTISLSAQDIEPNILSRWQSVQREIQREFRLLATGIIFLISAQTETTKQKKLNKIQHNTTKLIGYCQIMIQKNKE